MSEIFFFYVLKTAFIGVQFNIWIENNFFRTVPKNQVFYRFLAECVRLVLPKLNSTYTERFFEPKKLPFSKHPHQPSGHQWKFFHGFSLSSGREVKVAFTSVQSEILKENIFLDKCKNSTFTEVVEDVFDWCPHSYFLGEF